MQDDSVDWGMYFSSYIKTYLERDVRQLAAVQDLDVFRKFMVACAARTGHMLNYSSIADEVGKDAKTKWFMITAGVFGSIIASLIITTVNK